MAQRDLSTAPRDCPVCGYEIRLSAAAPDLLAALDGIVEEVVDTVDLSNNFRLTGALMAARAALARARADDKAPEHVEGCKCAACVEYYQRQQERILNDAAKARA